MRSCWLDLISHAEAAFAHYPYTLPPSPLHGVISLHVLESGTISDHTINRHGMEPRRVDTKNGEMGRAHLLSPRSRAPRVPRAPRAPGDARAVSPREQSTVRQLKRGNKLTYSGSTGSGHRAMAANTEAG